MLPKGALGGVKTLTLSHRDVMFSIEFAALHFADPQRNRYAYQLEGFDPQWVTTDAGKRFATYTNLDPGRYVFRVRAANKDGVWSAEPAVLELIVTPPVWKMWWFRLLMAALALGAAYLLFRVRIRMLMRQKQALEEEVGSRTRELVRQNASIERQKREAELQKESVELAHRNISLLSDIGRRITANLDSEAIMTMLYQQVHALMDASVFGIGIYRPRQELIEYPFAMEKGKRYTPYTRSMREPNQLAVWCINHAEEVFINDLEQEYACYIDSVAMVSGADDMGTLEDGSLPTEPRSLIYVPISVNGQVRGIITVHSYRAHAYHRIDADMLTTLASAGADRVPGRRHGHRHRASGADFRPVLHDQAGAGRQWAGVEHNVQHRDVAARWQHPGRQHGRRGDAVHDRPAAQGEFGGGLTINPHGPGMTNQYGNPCLHVLSGSRGRRPSHAPDDAFVFLLGRAQHLQQWVGAGVESHALHDGMLHRLVLFLLVRMDVVLDIVFRMEFAFGHFMLKHRQRLLGLGGGDHPARGVFMQQVEDALGVFLIHQDFGAGFGFEGN